MFNTNTTVPHYHILRYSTTTQSILRILCSEMALISKKSVYNHSIISRHIINHLFLSILCSTMSQLPIAVRFIVIWFIIISQMNHSYQHSVQLQSHFEEKCFSSAYTYAWNQKAIIPKNILFRYDAEIDQSMHHHNIIGHHIREKSFLPALFSPIMLSSKRSVLKSRHWSSHRKSIIASNILLTYSTHFKGKYVSSSSHWSSHHKSITTSSILLK